MMDRFVVQLARRGNNTGTTREPDMKALSIIQAEHRNLGVTLLCFESLLSDIRNKQREADIGLFRAIIRYIDSFLYRVHHPKEDEHLFPALRRCHPDASDLIASLQEDHHNGSSICRGLGDILDRCASGEAGFDELHDAALDYIRHERRHIGTEEREILPLAREFLSASDWAPINEAFGTNNDPMFGVAPQQHYEQLSRVIHNVCIYNNPYL
jgi:branched-chain amino acid transport system ATP-binding protein